MSTSQWFGLLHNALWIVGLAMALAAVSYADWQRRLSQPRPALRQALAEPRCRAVWSLGLLLFCAGLALDPGPWWRQVAWAALALVFLVRAVNALRHILRGVP